MRYMSSRSNWNPAGPQPIWEHGTKPWEPGSLQSQHVSLPSVSADRISFITNSALDSRGHLFIPVLCLTGFVTAVELLKHFRAWYLNMKR